MISDLHTPKNQENSLNSASSNNEAEKQPLVSVIVPMYNAEKTIGRCLDSIVNQSYSLLQIILIDDGSTDSTRKLCERFLIDKRIELVTQENCGVSRSRNRGIQMVKGQFLTFVDADDYLDNRAIEFLLSAILRQSADIVIYGLLKEKDGVIVGTISSTEAYTFNRYNATSALADLIQSGLFGYTFNKLIKFEIIQENGILFQESLSLFEDIVFYCQLFKRVDRIHVMNDALYHYVVSNVSLSNSYREDRLSCTSQAIKSLTSLLDFYEMPTYLAHILLSSFTVLSVKYHFAGLRDNSGVVIKREVNNVLSNTIFVKYLKKVKNSRTENFSVKVFIYAILEKKTILLRVILSLNKARMFVKRGKV